MKLKHLIFTFALIEIAMLASCQLTLKPSDQADIPPAALDNLGKQVDALSTKMDNLESQINVVSDTIKVSVPKPELDELRKQIDALKLAFEHSNITQALEGKTQAENTQLQLNNMSSSIDTNSKLSLNIFRIICLIMLLAIVFFISQARWHRLTLKNLHALLPSQIATPSPVMDDENSKTLTAFSSMSHELLASQANVQSSLDRMIEIHMALQPKLDERDREIQRLRSGFEASLFKKFIRRFVRIDIGIHDRLKANIPPADSLPNLSRLMADALQECGVERFEPDIGGDYRYVEGVADSPKSIQTNQKDMQFAIAEVERAGYRFIEIGTERIIIPAEVIIYSYPTKEERGA